MLTIHTTQRSTIYQFDGFSTGYGAYIQGEFVGKFVVPVQYTGMIPEGDELATLLDWHRERKNGIRLCGAGRIQ
jgi:hypothetical protein